MKPSFGEENMERLTYRKGGIIATPTKLDTKFLLTWNNDDCNAFQEIISKLYEYEEADARGLLITLPCRIGEIVYCIRSSADTYDGTTYYKVVQEPFNLTMLNGVGESFFFSPEEAWEVIEVSGVNKG